MSGAVLDSDETLVGRRSSLIARAIAADRVDWSLHSGLRGYKRAGSSSFAREGSEIYMRRRAVQGDSRRTRASCFVRRFVLFILGRSAVARRA
jgi:hypothetical protein